MSATLLVGALASLSFGFTLGAISHERSAILGLLVLFSCLWFGLGIWIFS